MQHMHITLTHVSFSISLDVSDLFPAVMERNSPAADFEISNASVSSHPLLVTDWSETLD